MTNIIAQIFGILGMIGNIFVYQQKTQKGVLLWQIFVSLTFTVNYFMLGAVMGGILNIICIVRTLIFLFPNKTNAGHIGWTIAFIALFFTFYPISFLVFGTAPTPRNFVIEALPILAMTLQTIALRLGSAKAVRRIGCVASPMWLVYNFSSGSIGGGVSEILNLGSILVGMIRLDIKKKKPSQEEGASS